jgi:hypothetical protein
MLLIQEQLRCQRPSDMAAFLHQLSGGYEIAADDTSQAVSWWKRCDRRELQ